jgi:DNA-binding XRE family transcriptional regulator
MKKTLKTLRNEAGLTQIEAADVLNVSHDTIARWESGETYPSALQIAEICRVYKCKFEDIQWPNKN